MLLVNEVREQIPLYTPNRVDTLRASGAYWADPLSTTARLWWLSIVESPDAYLRHRLRVTEAIVGMSDMRVCIPYETGVGGPLNHPLVAEELTSLLGLRIGPNPSTALVMWAGWELATTPLLMHWAYALALMGICVVLARRRAYVLLSLAACSLILLASYAVLGIACDFRYAYTLTEATSLLAAWVMLAHPKRMPHKCFFQRH